MFICLFLFLQEEGGTGVNYRGSVDIKAELGRTQSKVRIDMLLGSTYIYLCDETRVLFVQLTSVRFCRVPPVDVFGGRILFFSWFSVVLF